jgi:alkylation response protein AidB-like acyl-CoA dehydrogenase
MLNQFTEEQRMLRESVRQFVDTEVRPFIPVMEEHHTFPRDLLARCGELGLTGLVFDEEYGGSAQGLTAFCIALEEISRATQTLAITLDADMTLCYLPIARYGTEEQKAAYLPAGIAGTAVGAYAMSEPVGATDFAQQTTVAVKNEDGWLINGQKIFCTNSEGADVLLVFARVDDNVSPTCFIVESTNPGFRFEGLERKLGWNGSGTGTVVFDNCWVPDSAVLGQVHAGMLAVIGPILESCVGIGAMCVGAAAGALAKTFEYVKSRFIRGKFLIQEQGVSDTIARMAMDIETSRSLVYRTAALVDEGQAPFPGKPISVLASACKIQPPEMAAWVCDQAIQLHGGSGYINDVDIHRYWRDVRACQIGEGPTWGHLARITQALTAQDLI